MSKKIVLIVTTAYTCFLIPFVYINLFIEVITNYISEFLSLFVIIAMFLMLLGMTVFGLVIFITGAVKKVKLAFLPLLIAAAFVALQLFFPFADAYVALDYGINQSARELVVEKVLSGEIRDDKMKVVLPPAARYLTNSRSGELWIVHEDDVLIVLFTTYVGLLDGGVKGFFYVSDKDFITENMSGGKYRWMKKLKDHWYYGMMT